MLIFDPLRLICRDADIVECLILPLKPIDLLADKMGFKLSRTPSYLSTGPAVAIERNAQPLPVFDGRWLLLFFLEH